MQTTYRYSNGEGEVLEKGRINFIGYLRDPEKTAIALDTDGWYHTGDIGRFDSEGIMPILVYKEAFVHSNFIHQYIYLKLISDSNNF